MSENRQSVQLPGGLGTVVVSNQQAKILNGRKTFVEKYCKDRGWDMLNVTMDQLLEIRSQPGWKNPV